MLFEVLGPISVELADGSRARVPRGRVQAFLALLLVHRGDTVHLDRIVDELWGDPGPRHAKNAVHVLASRLRGAGLGDAVVFEGGGYALRAPSASLDADLFEAGLRRGRAELASGQAGTAAVTLAHRARPVAGPGAARRERRSLRAARDRAARGSAAHLRRGTDRGRPRLWARGRGHRRARVARPQAPLPRAPPRTAHDRPLPQRPAAEALATYREARGALVEGLGIEPSPWLRELERAILRHRLVNEISAYCR